MQTNTNQAAAGITIVTGGASGIGLAVVQLLAKLGRRVLVLDHSADNIAATQKNLAQWSALIAYEQMDITQEALIAPLLARYHTANEPIMGLVNSAGFGRDIAFLDTDSAIVRAIFEVNVLGAFNLSREVASLMKDSGGGSIVHVASVSGLIGNKGRSAYGPSKAALVNLTQIMSHELAEYGIRVNCICPGPIETPLAMSVHSDAVQNIWKNAVPQRRYGQPEEVAQAIEFFLNSQVSSYITGQILSVDGGFISAGLESARSVA